MISMLQKLNLFHLNVQKKNCGVFDVKMEESFLDKQIIFQHAGVVFIFWILFWNYLYAECLTYYLNGS